MKPSFARLLALGGGLLFATGAGAAGGWDGTYVHTSSHGRTAGGTPVSAEYRVLIAEGSAAPCVIQIDGFQSDETLHCTLRAAAGSLSVLFKSHDTGDVVNIHGVAVYRPGQELLRFERVARGGKTRLVTRWTGLTTLDGTAPAAEETFVRTAGGPGRR